jgi:subtilisin family serine protease
MTLPGTGTAGRHRAPGIKHRSVVLGLATAAVTVAGVIAGSSGAVAAEGTIEDAGTAAVVAGSFVVVLNGSTGVSPTDLAEQYGGTVGYTYTRALRGFSIRISEDRVKRLAANPAVQYVQRDGVHHLAETQQLNPPSWGLDRIDERSLPLSNSYTFPSTASNVRAYIIDTGIRTSHHDFGGRATSGFDAIDGGSADDCHGHGTHVAGIVGGSTFGVAKGVGLVAVRVLDCQGSGTTAGVVAGIDWVTANAAKPAVANMSLGGGVDETVDNAVARSIASGVTYALAAGNGNADACNFSPARVPAAITVGSTNSSDARSSSSNYGSCVDLFAPGSSITSTWHTSDTATNTAGGTSMAAPHVAGGAALALGLEAWRSPQQVRDYLVGRATADVVGNAGAGSPNRLLYVRTGTSSPPPPPPPETQATCTGSNGTDVSIPDAGGAVTSSIGIWGCDRNASASATVEVHVLHTWRGDLVIDLLAPDGTAYRLKSNDFGDGADHVHATYTVNLSGEWANGTWVLQVRDVYQYDTGYIDGWTLTI